MTACPKRRKMAFGSNVANVLVTISWNTFLLVIFLNLAASRRIPTTDVDTIQISLGHTSHVTDKVPLNSKVILKCTFDNPTWFINGEKFKSERKMKTIKLEKIKKADAHEYACRGENNEWSNLTLSVKPEGDIKEIPFPVTEKLPSKDYDNEGEEEDYEYQDIAPTFTHANPLQNIIKPPGSIVKINCAATGDPRPNVTWTKYDKPVVRSSGSVNYKKWSIIIEDAVPTDSGIYKCKVCNIYDCIERQTKVIIQDHINHQSILINEMSNQTVRVNGSANIECTLLSGNSDSVQWIRGKCVDCKVQSDNLIKNENILKLSNVSYNDQGWYTCIATNSEGSAYSSVFLHVVDDNSNYIKFADNMEVLSQVSENTTKDSNKDLDTEEKDEIANDETKFELKFNHSSTQNVVKPSGSFVKINCAATGFPTPNITWTKNDKPIARYMGNVNYKKWAMSMEDAIPDDSGIYKCKVCNINSCIERSTKIIIQERVNHKPIFLSKFSNQTLVVNNSTEMKCEVLSDLNNSIQWIRGKCDACKVHNNDIIKSDPQHQDILKLVNVTHEDEGWYTCVASNSLGNSYASAYLRVVDDISELSDSVLIAPNRTHSLWLTIGSMAIALFFLIGAGFLFWALRKYKHEKLIKHRMETVHQWTKKVVIYKPSSEPGMSDEMIMPIIKIEKQRTTLLQSSNTDPAPFNEYEFPLDSNWEIPRNQLTLGTTLGEGAFGRVVMAEAYGLEKMSKCSIVAVKMVKEGHTDADMASLVREMEVMKMIGKHINIINLLGCCSQDGPLYVIVEFAPHGNLKDFLKKNRPLGDPDFFGHEDPDRTILTQKDLISFAFQVARGMEYLASRRCIHRDLAARNVLVSDDYIMKIADFGLARDIQDTDYYRKNTNGRLPVKWMAPESLQEKFYDTQSDVWSYGVLLWEIMTFGEQPYPKVTADELYSYLIRGERMDRPPRCSLNIYMLMRQCWNFDAHARPTFTEIVENLDKILTATANANEEYLDLNVPLLETPPSTDDESDTDTIRETTLLRYK